MMRDNCLMNNEEANCTSFVDGFKLCLESKRAEVAARKAAALIVSEVAASKAAALIV